MVRLLTCTSIRGTYSAAQNLVKIVASIPSIQFACVSPSHHFVAFRYVAQSLLGSFERRHTQQYVAEQGSCSRQKGPCCPRADGGVVGVRFEVHAAECAEAVWLVPVVTSSVQELVSSWHIRGNVKQVSFKRVLALLACHGHARHTYRQCVELLRNWVNVRFKVCGLLWCWSDAQ